MTWAEAQSYCRLKYADLATVTNAEDQLRLLDLVKREVPHAWIGLRKGSTRRWMWSDGSGPAQYTPWAENEPNNVDPKSWCAEMRSDGFWNNDNCGFVCYECE